jgi:hypothetical protein
MTAGAAQTMLKSSALVPDGRTVIAGQGPLLWLLAAQILRLGGRIDCILDTTERLNYLAALPHAFAFVTSPYLAKGFAMMREVKAKVPVTTGVTELAAAGEGRLASVSYVTGSRRETIPADLLLLHQGVVPNVNLAMAAGVEHRWDDLQLCWSPVLDGNGSTSIEGVAIAGDGAGIGGANAAVVRGRIAARAAVEALSPTAAVKLTPMIALKTTLAQVERGRAFRASTCPVKSAKLRNIPEYLVLADLSASLQCPGICIMSTVLRPVPTSDRGINRGLKSCGHGTGSRRRSSRTSSGRGSTTTGAGCCYRQRQPGPAA